MARLEGTVLSGRWEVGPVFEHAESRNSKLVTHTGKDRERGDDVLVVALRPEWASDPKVRAEYLFGIRAVTPLEHEGIARLRGHVLEEQAGQLCFVTELLPWHTRSLARMLGDGAVLSEHQAVALARQVLEALAFAHERGVVFGNVKPSNILVPKGAGRAVVNGLPKPPFEFSSIPQLGAYLGKPWACAPELLATGRFDARADVYGLGLVLYELAAGRLPYHASDNLGVLFSAIVREPQPPVAEQNPELSPRLAEIIMQAVEKDPARRFASAREMSAALAKVQARPIALLTPARLGDMVGATMPSPLAHAFASIDQQVDELARLQRLIDTAQACMTLIGAIVLAARQGAKLPPIPDESAAASFSRPSLGHWAAIVREGTRGTTFEAVPELSSVMFVGGKPSSASKAIDALVTLRNEVRHGSTPTAATARKKLGEARAQLERLLAELLFLRDYRLFVPRALDYVDEGFLCDARVLRGARAPARQTLQLRQPVTVGNVYLADADMTRVLSLSPMVQLATCPVCEDEEVFFYESAAADRVHYLSYQKGHSLAREEAIEAFRKRGLL
jgi:hypothetical protein